MVRLDDKSRMNREIHVRIREGVEVRLPCATRLNHISSQTYPCQFQKILYIDVKIKFLIAISRYVRYPPDSRVNPVG